MTQSHALLISQQTALGRTNLVRLAAFLAKIKYFESRITNDPAKSETYLKEVLKQCSLISGIKASHTIIYIKCEHHAHHVLDNLLVFIRTGLYPNLFTEQEICHIASEIHPAVKSDRRQERTLHVFNSFLSTVRDKVHVIISLDSSISPSSLNTLLRRHSTLFTDFYIDIYRPFDNEALLAIARFYLYTQAQKTRLAQKMSINKPAYVMEIAEPRDG
jgi:hypothetical protein